jgi:hypothetical protein
MEAPRRPRFDPNPPAPLRARPMPKKAVALAVFLFICGFGFTATGLSMIATRPFWSETVPFLAIGTMTLIPGSYVLFTVFQVARGVPNWTYDQLRDLDSSSCATS